jgi:hypothetical protein
MDVHQLANAVLQNAAAQPLRSQQQQQLQQQTPLVPLERTDSDESTTSSLASPDTDPVPTPATASSALTAPPLAASSSTAASLMERDRTTARANQEPTTTLPEHVRLWRAIKHLDSQLGLARFAAHLHIYARFCVWRINGRTFILFSRVAHVSSSDSRSVGEWRAQLRTHCGDLLVLHPRYALSKHVVNKLWTRTSTPFFLCARMICPFFVNTLHLRAWSRTTE